jgi:YHS domain-containing protein
MRKISVTVAAGSLVLGVAATVWAGCGACGGDAAHTHGQAEVKAQTTCPVMGGKINKSQYVDVKGKRIYVCCPGCIGKIKADPDEYIEKLEDEGVTVAKLQTHCPVMGGKINTAQYADVKGKRIYVCCPGCIGKIEAAPEKYIAKLEKDGVALDTTPSGKDE